jgi:hypothetical protein
VIGEQRLALSTAEQNEVVSEAIDCRHKKAPTEPGLQVNSHLQRGPTRHGVGVQTAQVTETLVLARTVHAQVDRQSVVMLSCPHAIKNQEY